MVFTVFTRSKRYFVRSEGARSLFTARLFLAFLYKNAMLITGFGVLCWELNDVARAHPLKAVMCSSRGHFYTFARPRLFCKSPLHTQTYLVNKEFSYAVMNE